MQSTDPEMQEVLTEVLQALDQSTEEMTLNQFQAVCSETATYPEAGTCSKDAFSYTVLGLCGESGELADKWKKNLRGDHGEPGQTTPAVREAMMAEAGDVAWYLARIATELGVSLSDIARGNIRKLRSRQDRGVIKGSGDYR